VSSSLERLKDSHAVDVHWRSFELRPAGTALPPGYRERILAARPRLEELAKVQYGLDINSGPFGINSRSALLGAKFAEAKGLGDAYHKAVFDAYWQKGQSIEDPAVLREIAGQVGLDPDDFDAALKDPRYDAEVAADIAQAQAHGLHGVPALVFDNKYLVSGAQPYDVLTRIVEQIEHDEQDGAAAV
jgi:predicted DsbA family dithiol-disulfide isomerase